MSETNFHLGMRTSKTCDWATPQKFFNEVNHEFQFTVDVCADAKNAKCPVFYSAEQDGLKQPWTGRCWMNPPYGREIGRWCSKAFMASSAGALVVGLLPARTDTKWFHEFILNRAEIRWIKGRLSFGTGTGRAPFPSMLAIWRPGLSAAAMPLLEPALKKEIAGMREGK